METTEKYKIKLLLRKACIASGKKYLNKASRKAVLEGYQALKKLGIYEKPAYACDRKEKR